MKRVSRWNIRCNNHPMEKGTPEWKQSMLNQLERLQEELDETVAAVNELDELETLDGLVDMQVVLEGVIFLAGMEEQQEEAFDRVMDNNDLKYTHDYEEAILSVEFMGVDNFHIQEYTDSNNRSFYSVHRNKDNKICKLLNHPRVDLSDLV